MKNILTTIGLVLTAIYILLIVNYRRCDFINLGAMKANEMGDFLAGVFAPLALFWLVIGYFQQQKELRQNTKALELQAKELKNSVTQQTELVKITKKQLEVEQIAFNNEEERQLRKFHPKIIINGGKHKSTNTEIYYKLSLLNHGESVSQVSIEMEPKILNSKVSIPETFDKQNHISILWEKNTPEDLEVILTCECGNTKMYTKIFKLSLENGRYSNNNKDNLESF